MKKFDEFYASNKLGDRFKNIKYVEREEDPELKKMYDDEVHRVRNLQNELGHKVDGEISIDIEGNVEIKELKSDE